MLTSIPGITVMVREAVLVYPGDGPVVGQGQEVPAGVLVVRHQLLRGHRAVRVGGVDVQVPRNHAPGAVKGLARRGTSALLTMRQRAGAPRQGDVRGQAGPASRPLQSGGGDDTQRPAATGAHPRRRRLPFRAPATQHFGPGAVERVGGRGGAPRRPAGPGHLRPRGGQAGIAGRVRDLLEGAGVATALYAEVEPEPSVASIERALEVCRLQGAQGRAAGPARPPGGGRRGERPGQHQGGLPAPGQPRPPAAVLRGGAGAPDGPPDDPHPHHRRHRQRGDPQRHLRRHRAPAQGGDRQPPPAGQRRARRSGSDPRACPRG